MMSKQELLAEFARKRGSKDKAPRKRRLLKTAGALALAGGSALAYRKLKKSGLKGLPGKDLPALPGASKRTMNAEKVARRRSAIEQTLMDNYKRSNQGGAKLADEKRLRQSAKVAPAMGKSSRNRIKQASQQTRKRLGANYNAAYRLSYI